MQFHGPYTDGPPAGALEIDSPDLNAFGLRELWRMLVIVVTLTIALTRGLCRKLIHPGSGSWLRQASEGMVDGFFVLGPTFVKVGQMVASSPGLFPDDIAGPCRMCLQEVPPFEGAIARAVIAADLGADPDEIFSSFADEPLSAASVGQVHACTLADGRDAVVKLLRPDIHRRMNTDLRIVYRLAKLAAKTEIGRKANIDVQIEELHELTNQELNASLEAQRQDRFRSRIHDFGDNDCVTVPEVYWDYCGPNVICMERLYGVPMDDYQGIAERATDARLALRWGMKAWVEALVFHGPFHGDLHAGNVWALDDGRVAFLDFGIMGELDDGWRAMLRDILRTFMLDDDFERVVRGYKRLGVLSDDLGDDAQLATLMKAAFEPILTAKMEDLNFGDLFMQAIAMAEEFGDIQFPRELTLIGKQFLYFERYVKGIAPDYLVVTDLYLIKNVFPGEVVAKAADTGLELPA